jgi:hypothetical protein
MVDILTAVLQNLHVHSGTSTGPVAVSSSLSRITRMQRRPEKAAVRKPYCSSARAVGHVSCTTMHSAVAAR